MPDPTETLLRIAAILDELSIPYCVVGSLASSHYGIPRSTNDVDVVVKLREDQVGDFVAAVDGEFYADEIAIADAVAAGHAFNIIDRETFDKVDVFPPGREGWKRDQLERRRAIELDHGEGSRVVYFASAEDTILAKLAWYADGGEVSDRQWRDIVGVVRAMGDRLDRELLEHAAAEASLSVLLERALAAG